MPTPVEAGKTGGFDTFEKGVTKLAGGKGFANVWWRGRFGWRYNGQRRLRGRLPAATSCLLGKNRQVLCLVCSGIVIFPAYFIPWRTDSFIYSSLATSAYVGNFLACRKKA